MLGPGEPVAGTEPILDVNYVTETSIPVEYDQNVVHQTECAKNVGIVGVTLCPVQERPEAINFDQAETTENGLEANGQVQKVQGQQAQTVNVEKCTVHVVLPQLDTVRLQNALLQVACAKVDKDVEDVDEIGEVVEQEPSAPSLVVDLLECAPVDDGPEVVQECDAHYHGPVVAQTARRVENERPIAARFVMGRGYVLPLFKLFLDLLPSHFAHLFGHFRFTADYGSIEDVACKLGAVLLLLNFVFFAIAYGHCGHVRARDMLVQIALDRSLLGSRSMLFGEGLCLGMIDRRGWKASANQIKAHH